MGELFAHFQGWDVQAIRKEAREEAREEARKEVWEEARKEVWEEARKEARILARKQVESELEEARKEVTQQVTQQVTEQVTEADIRKLLTVLHKLGCSRETAIEQLMEQYQLAYESSAKKVDDLWERS